MVQQRKSFKAVANQWPQKVLFLLLLFTTAFPKCDALSPTTTATTTNNKIASTRCHSMLCLSPRSILMKTENISQNKNNNDGKSSFFNNSFQRVVSLTRNQFESLKQRLWNKFHSNIPISYANDNDEVDIIIEQETMHWIQKSVVGLSLCPFAEKPIKEQTLFVTIVRGDDHATIGEAVSNALDFTANEAPGTTAIVVAPEYYSNDFERYLGMVQFLEQRVMIASIDDGSDDDEEVRTLADLVQIAPFHPLFCLDNNKDNSEKDTIDVYINRSPYPMFHVIRTDDVDRAVEKLDGDPGKVWRRNKRLLENLEKRMGRETAVSIATGKITEEEESKKKVINEVIKQTAIEMKQEERQGVQRPVERGTWER